MRTNYTIDELQHRIKVLKRIEMVLSFISIAIIAIPFILLFSY